MLLSFLIPVTIIKKVIKCYKLCLGITLIFFSNFQVVRSFDSRAFYMQRGKDMKNLTTPQAVLYGFVLVALAIASIPYSSNIVSPSHAAGSVQKIAICNTKGTRCPYVSVDMYGMQNRALAVQNQK